ncbi:hypothetical protein J5991_10145, partial [Methanocorpusculum sp.]|nr:hypothetical protein [Methanocorpusculum sp.]
VEERAPFATSSVTIPKRVYDTVGGFDITHSYNEDTELFGKIALQYPVVIDTRIRVYYHTEDLSSLSKHPPRNYTHPFLEVIANISESNCTINYSSLQLYADSIKLESAMLNLWNGDDAMYCYHMKTLHVHKNHRKKIILLKLYHVIPVVIRSNKRFKDLVYSLRQIMR